MRLFWNQTLTWAQRTGALPSQGRAYGRVPRLLLAFGWASSYLSLGELQSRGQQEPLRTHHVLLPGELLLQPGQLLAGEAGAYPFRLSSFGFERMHSCVDSGQRGCRQAKGRI